MEQMTAKVIGDVLQSRFDNHEHIFRNKYIFQNGWHESDFFCVGSTGYAIEAEIKISRSDFKADFNKDKHKIMQAAFQKKTFLTLPSSYWTVNKESCGVQFYDIESAQIPNRFWFAVPSGLLTIKDIPPYAGLIEIFPRGEDITPYERVIKPAPFIHKRILPIKQLLFDKYYYGFGRLKEENYLLKQQLEELKHQIQL